LALYFGRFPDADGLPANVAVPDGTGGTVAPFRLGGPCSVDPNHSFAEMHAKWNEGRNDGFVAFDGVGPWASTKRRSCSRTAGRGAGAGSGEAAS
jgi:phospholipase C